MQLIPVLDLMNGQVVRAIGGRRDGYRPVQSRLCEGSDPVAVARAMLDLAPFRSLYVADLDAIMHERSARAAACLASLCVLLGERHGAGTGVLAGERRGAGTGVLAGERKRAETGELWVDAGWFDAARGAALRAPWRAALERTAKECGVQIVWVVGSESLDSALGATAWPWHDEDVLSLDQRNGISMGKASWIEDPRSWPRRVIAMELAAVGADAGPALDRIAELRVRARAAGRNELELIAAGGVRDAGDLQQLETLGVSAVLLASALHDARLTPSELQNALGG